MASLLTARHVTKRFGGISALRDCNFEVDSGEIVAVIGPNGAGKSTLLNCIAGHVRPDEGEILFRGTNLCGLSPDQIANLGISRTFQNIHLFSELTVLQNVQIGVSSFRRMGFWKAFFTGGGAADREAETRALAVLRRLGMEEFAGVAARELSFGQQRLVELARALCMQPQLLLLDEPASGLNETEAERLLELLAELSRDGMAIVWIEHDLASVMKIAHKVVVLEFGERICYGSPEEVRKDPKFIDAYLGTGSPVRAAERKSRNDRPYLLVAENLHTYRGTVHALKGVDVRIRRGELLAVIGPNGAGKSTLLGTLAGQFRPRQGSIEFQGVAISGEPPERVHRAGLTLVPERRGMFPSLTVEESLMLGAYAEVGFVRSLGLPPKEVVERCEKMYELFPRLRERRRQLSGTLSGGEQQMLAIARGLMSRPSLLMLDEPSLGLAEKIVEQLFAVLRRLADEGMAILLVEQNARAALGVADRIMVLDLGTVRYEGLPKQFDEETILGFYTAREMDLGH